MFTQRVHVKRNLVFVNSKQLTEIMHDNGVNLRFLAYLRSIVNNKHIRQFLLFEMLSRAVKTALRGKMRKLSHDQKCSEDQPYKEVAAQYFNLILGTGRGSDEFWRTNMNIILMLKFSLLPFNGREDKFTQGYIKRKSLFEIEHRNYQIREQIGSKLYVCPFFWP